MIFLNSRYLSKISLSILVHTARCKEVLDATELFIIDVHGLDAKKSLVIYFYHWPRPLKTELIASATQYLMCKGVNLYVLINLCKVYFLLLNVTYKW